MESSMDWIYISCFGPSWGWCRNDCVCVTKCSTNLLLLLSDSGNQLSNCFSCWLCKQSQISDLKTIVHAGLSISLKANHCILFFIFCTKTQYVHTWSFRTLRALTSNWRPCGPCPLFLWHSGCVTHARPPFIWQARQSVKNAVYRLTYYPDAKTLSTGQHTIHRLTYYPQTNTLSTC